jgi:hypothetical protein
MLTKRSSKSAALMGFAVFGLAVAGVAIGAMAIGALAIGALRIGRLGMGTGRIEELSIGKLTVDELVVKSETKIDSAAVDYRPQASIKSLRSQTRLVLFRSRLKKSSASSLSNLLRVSNTAKSLNTIGGRPVSSSAC